MAHDMVKERDEDSGQYTTSVTDHEILAFLRENDGAATSEVAEEFDYRRESAYRRLKALEETGQVTSRTVGNSLLWLPKADH